MLRKEDVLSFVSLPELQYRVRRIHVSWQKPKDPRDHNHVLEFQFILEPIQEISKEEVGRWVDHLISKVKEQPAYKIFSKLLREMKSREVFSVEPGEEVESQIKYLAGNAISGLFLKVPTLSSINLHKLANLRTKVGFNLPRLSELDYQGNPVLSLSRAIREFEEKMKENLKKNSTSSLPIRSLEFFPSRANERASFCFLSGQHFAETEMTSGLLLDLPPHSDLFFLSHLAKSLESSSGVEYKKFLKIRDLPPKGKSKREMVEISLQIDACVHDEFYHLDPLVVGFPEFSVVVLGVVVGISMLYESFEPKGEGEDFHVKHVYNSFAVLVNKERINPDGGVSVHLVPSSEPQAKVSLVKRLDPNDRTESLEKFMDLVRFIDRHRRLLSRPLELWVEGRRVRVLDYRETHGDLFISEESMKRWMGGGIGSHLAPLFSEIGIQNINVFATSHMLSMLGGKDYDGIIFHSGADLSVDFFFNGRWVNAVRDKLEVGVEFS